MVDLFNWQAPTPYPAKGETFVQERDGERLAAQAQRVHDFVVGRGWVTLAQISAATGDPEASISARLRDLRHIGFSVERVFVARGLWRYRVGRPAT